MRQEEEQGIERLLNAVGGTEPPTGMQDRIHNRLARHNLSAAPQPTAGLQWSWLTGALAMAAILIAALLLHQHSASHPAAALSAQAKMASPASAPEKTTAKVHQPSRLVTLPDAAPRRKSKGAGALQPQSSELASFPAPEAPLTQQERLLLHIAQHPGPEDLALLNPEIRDEIAQMSRADFNQFFPQPLPQERFYELQNKDR